MQEVSLFERLMATAGGLFISLAVSALAFHYGYFRKIQPTKNPPVSFYDFFAVLMMFLMIKLVIAPATFVAAYVLVTGQAIDSQSFMGNPSLQGSFNAIVIVQLLLCFSFYLYLLRPQLRPLVFGTTTSPIREISIGVVSWFIAYPWVFTASQGMEALVNVFSPGPPIEQEAIQNLRGVLNEPFVLIITLVLVAIVVPVIEEIIFRGFLQQWLKKVMHPWWAILVTTCAFAFAHFSTAQGLSNLPIISALFILSIFLGFLRERQNCLLAPIALHAMVNTVTLTILLLQEHLHENYSAILDLLFSS